MIKHVVLLLKLSMIYGIFDPSKIDYSKLQCDRDPDNPTMTLTNTVCTCWVSDNIVEITEDIVKFRTEVLKQHNELRNRLGNGTEKRLKSAANMNALSYDPELEYFARCVSTKFGKQEGARLQCRRTSRFQKPGKIYYFGGDENPHNISTIFSPSVEDSWYNVKVNYLSKRGKINPFWVHARYDDISELFWWSNTHLGCARIAENLTNLLFYYVICDYGGASPSLIDHENVYEEGKGCSKCSKDVNCNSAYNGLCGEISPIPTDKPIPIGTDLDYEDICLDKLNIRSNGELTIGKTKKLLFIVLITIIFFLD